MNLGGVGDHPTGIALAQGVAAALYRKLKTGQGDKVSVSLYHAGMWTTATMQPAVQVGNRYPQPYEEPVLLPVMGHPYKTADGEWIIFMLFDFDKYWKPLTYPSGKTFYMPTPPIQFRNGGKPDYRPASDVGADTREVLIRNGYSEDDITSLVENKVIRPPAQ